MINPRCPNCDHDNIFHTGEGCAKCSCNFSPRRIMEERLMLAEEDINRHGRLIAELTFRLESLERATRAYGIIE